MRFLYIFLIALAFAAGFFACQKLEKEISNEIPIVSEVIPKPLEKYTIENLSKKDVPRTKFTIKDQIDEQDSFTSNLFELSFSPILEKNSSKKVTGQINLPVQGGIPKEDTFPIIIMLRGYINQETYKTGDGTRNAAAFFAENGFITVAPDFLGYGGSDSESGDIFETRFQTYTTVISLLESLPAIEKWDKKNIFIWGHSNGGQVALTVLAVTGANFPTTLWAPVSKFFPYSILYYTDSSDDRGKLIRNELAEFEDLYDTDLYSYDLYLERVSAPILIHQGEADDAIPVSWTQELVSKLKNLDKNVTFVIYPFTDHDMRPSWDTAVARDLEFFKKHTSGQ
jgi:dipeptidyl aminopeptidase/acylaminoacyl peptidase